MINGQNFFEQQLSLEEAIPVTARQATSLLFPVKIVINTCRLL
jgi:hypothetical protein